jgi:hypothetical protein
MPDRMPDLMPHPMAHTLEFRMPALHSAFRLILLCTATLSLLAGGAAAQTKETDPRHGEDPRTGADPHKGQDPRAAEKDPYAELEGRELYDALLAAGEEGRLRQVFRDDAWQILGYIDSHCEGWLALKERGALATEEGAKQAADMQATGRKLAEMADQVLGDTRLVAYVTSFYGWNDEQQKRFREGQKLFREGASLYREAKSPAEAMNAISPLQQSLGHARALGDTWGQSMALSLIGRVEADNRHYTESTAALKEAVRIGREIRDIDAVWGGLGALYETAIAEKAYEPARDALQEQYLVAKELNDVATAERIVKQLVDLDTAFEKN